MEEKVNVHEHYQDKVFKRLQYFLILGVCVEKKQPSKIVNII